MTTMSSPMAQQLAGKGAARHIRRAERMTGGRRRPGPVSYALLTVILIISVFPLYYAFLLSTSTAQNIARNPLPSLLPKGHFMANLSRVADSGIPLWQSMGNSVIVAVITSASTVFFATLAGFAFSKLRFRGRNGLLAFVVGTMAVPTQLGVVPLFIVMSKLEWTGKLVAVIVPALVTAFGVFWMTQYLSEALPVELIEAARIDGCSMIRTFYHVALPAARPAAAMLALFTFVGSWTNFFWPFIVLGATNPTLPVALQLLQASYFKDMSLIMAGVVIATVPLLALFAVAGRHLVSGIMAGAVKG
ncbi:Binding-protein-dependent transport systems inner membrane component [Acidipropionibacterium acidipropionici ATCC 4875]|uniref:Binding-protein-dependent transport systems inner membrane component n=1 Tax=Acidipropionibacterium acidipropionici (strain ATCC 4875 / DSM 20272 / JCM 6432 / NBRC 12425 / NCIMB 8070 / 4) TaxID=1171373 RepID=K7RT82_ACIA4|nr:carbohydrate ABC transporter permease [Acidipropionibacterium acidipropionici]AFV89621.1 Binding-protein-dependent transport systems inner membrane component [Acidipropionibacterium acidipropionici ATCC 4875]